MMVSLKEAARRIREHNWIHHRAELLNSPIITEILETAAVMFEQIDAGMLKPVVYVRFGEIPQDEHSKIYDGDFGVVGTENGVSVWYAVKIDGKYHLIAPNPSTSSTYSDFCFDAFPKESHHGCHKAKPIYIVNGDYVGKGSDGEPLITNINIVEELPSDYFWSSTADQSIMEENK